MTEAPEPREAYASRLDEWARMDADLTARESRLESIRLGLFLGGGLVCVWIMYGQPAWWPALALPVLAFAAAVAQHHKAHAAAERARSLHAWYQRASDRLVDAWPGTGPTGQEYLADESLFGHDIDLFGEGSLYQRLATTPTSLGHRRLAVWLTQPAAPDVIRSRQEALRELAPLLDLREELAIVGETAGEVFRPDALAAWGRNGSVHPQASALRVTSWVFGAVGLFCAGAWAVGSLSVGPLGLVIIVDLLFEKLVGKRRQQHGQELVHAGRGLAWLAKLLQLLEEGRFQSPELQSLRTSLNQSGEQAGEQSGDLPSASIHELTTLVDKLEASKRNAVYSLFAFIAQVPLRTALDLDDWRSQHGLRVADWLDAAGHFEALLALGTYAYERPDDCYPEILDGSSGDARFVAQGLGHPLIPDASCVRNDLRLDQSMRLLLLSGSNMSGKSTLLRAVGTNLSLAMAGAPTKATSLSLTPLALGASIRIEDSLSEGTSHFYAEIKRLRLIDELMSKGPWPVLYLLDEVLHGTNSRDRLAGSSAIVKKFVAKGALGIVTTHDLALARIADELGELARNAHLEDSIVDGEMHFDYTLREGVVTRGNALPLMRSLGLDV